MELFAEASGPVLAMILISTITAVLLIVLFVQKCLGLSVEHEFLLLNIAPDTSPSDLRQHLTQTLQSKLTNRGFVFGKTTALFTCSDKLGPDEWEMCEKFREHRMTLIHKKSSTKVQCSERQWDRRETGEDRASCRIKVKRITEFRRVELSGKWTEIIVLLDQLSDPDQPFSREDDSRKSFGVSISDETTAPLLGKYNRNDKRAKRQEKSVDIVQPDVRPLCDSNKREVLNLEEDLYRYAMQYHKGEMDRILSPKSFSSEFKSGNILTLVGQACLVSKAVEDMAVFCQSLTSRLGKDVFKLSEHISIEEFRRRAESLVATPNRTMLLPSSNDTFKLYGPTGKLKEVKEGLKSLENELKKPVARNELHILETNQKQPTQPEYRQQSYVEVSRSSCPTETEKAKANKLAVSVFKGDLTKQCTEVIVNPANSKLQHGGGAAKAIASAAGQNLRDECRAFIRKNGYLEIGEVTHTTAGKLSPPIKYVIHAVGPSAEKYPVEEELEEKVEETFFNCLSYANDELGAKSISIPAISSGIYGVPKELVARAARTALKRFEQQETARAMTLKEVNFVNIDDESTDAFLEVFGGTRSRKASLDANLGKVGSGEGEKSRSKSVDQPKRKRILIQKVPGSVPNQEGAADGLSNDVGAKVTTATVANGDESEDCVICMETMTSPKSLPCGHKFCEDCIKDSFEKCQPKCPSCGRLFGVMRGNQPPGKMYVSTIAKSLNGYGGYKTIVVEYDIPSGMQDDSHPNPGVQYCGTHRTAYLPDNKEGREVYDLLQKAFDAGLIFTVGRSTTTARDNQVIWNDIHHKTSEVGPYGYPDPSYLSRVKEELKAKGIVSDANDHKHKQTVI